MFSLLLYFAQKLMQTNSVDNDQTPSSVASGLGLHCLHMFPKRVSSLKRVKIANGCKTYAYF